MFHINPVFHFAFWFNFTQRILILRIPFLFGFESSSTVDSLVFENKLGFMLDKDYIIFFVFTKTYCINFKEIFLGKIIEIETVDDENVRVTHFYTSTKKNNYVIKSGIRNIYYSHFPLVTRKTKIWLIAKIDEPNNTFGCFMSADWMKIIEAIESIPRIKNEI